MKQYNTQQTGRGKREGFNQSHDFNANNKTSQDVCYITVVMFGSKGKKQRGMAHLSEPLDGALTKINGRKQNESRLGGMTQACPVILVYNRTLTEYTSHFNFLNSATA